MDFLREVARKLQEFSSADVVELRLMERNRHYISLATADASQPDAYSVIPLSHNEEGEMSPPFDLKNDFEFLCWAVIRGHYDSESPFFTRSGGFWTWRNDVALELAGVSSGQTQPRKISLAGGYESVIILPIMVEQDNIGLLILKSVRRNFIGRDEVSFYESLAQNVGVALAHRRTQVDLRERVKELTCLYGISRLVETPGITLDELLQGLTELLPPAWLYPQIARARVVLNDVVYYSPGYGDGPHHQRADILINGLKCGLVDVVYIEKRPDLDEGPFLKEERSLIDTIAREIALIIERRQAEEEKERLQEQLLHADRLATIGQLAAGVAHELNEPLGNILGFAQLTRKVHGLPDQTLSDLDKIISAALFAREVIRKLMLFARQAPSRKIPVALNNVVEDSLMLLESRLAKGGVEVIKKLQENLPFVNADPAQIGQILINLTVNASQAMPSGGVLTISTHRDDKTVSLTVEDTGVGMTDEVMKQIFIPFFTTKDVDQGTGLGLAVVHGIVTSHGGNIQVASEVSLGSRFTVSLPIEKTNGERER